jgi:hypothetical protein
MRMLDPGGTGGGGGGSSNDSAEEELTGRDPGSGDGGGGGGDIDLPDSVREDAGLDDGGSDDSSDAADELEERDPGSGDGGGGGSDTNEDAREELTDRDQGSGDGSSGSQDRSIDEGITSGGGETTTGDGQSADEQQQDAADELTGRDPGSGDGDGSMTDAEEELSGRDPGRPDQETIRDRELEQRARTLAEQNVEQDVNQGLEAGGTIMVDGREVDVTNQAQEFEQQAIQDAEFAQGESDVVVVERDGQLVAVPSRDRAIELQSAQIERELRQRRRREQFEAGQEMSGAPPDDLVVEVGPDGEIPDEALEDLETEIESENVTIPESVPLIGGREISGTGRDVDVTAEDGEIQVEESERFGDFDVNVPIVNRDLEELTGPAGEALMSGGEQVGSDIRQSQSGPAQAINPLNPNPFSTFMGIERLAAATDTKIRPDVPEVVPVVGGRSQADLLGEQPANTGFENVPIGLAAIGDQALNLPQETAEFGVEAASETAAGRGGEFAGDVGEAAVGKGIQLQETARANPAAFGGQLAGSAVAAGGSIAAARRLGGPRAGAAVDVAIQPGEAAVRAAATRGAISPRAATLVPGVRRGQFEVNSRNLEGSDFDAADADPRVADPMIGRVEGRLVGAGISARAGARNLRTRVSEASLGDVQTGLTRPMRAGRQRARELREQARGARQGAQLSAEAQLTRGAEGMAELVRESSTPPRPDPVRVDLDPGDLSRGDVDVVRVESDSETEADSDDAVTGAGVGSSGTTFDGPGGRGQQAVQEQVVGGGSEVEVEATSRVEPLFERRARRGFRTPEPAVTFETAVDPVMATEPTVDVGPMEVAAETQPDLVGPDAAQGPGQEVTPEQSPEVAQEPTTDTRTEPTTEVTTEVVTEPTTETRQEVATELTTEPAKETKRDPMLQDAMADEETMADGETFTETFEFGIAAPEEVLSPDGDNV